MFGSTDTIYSAKRCVVTDTFAYLGFVTRAVLILE